MKHIPAIIAVGFSLVQMSCSGPGDVTTENVDSERPAHSAEEIREKVDSILVQRRVQAEQYEVSALTFDYVDRQWTVYFLGKGANLDSHFAIMLKDDNLDDFKVVPGL